MRSQRPPGTAGTGPLLVFKGGGLLLQLRDQAASPQAWGTGGGNGSAHLHKWISFHPFSARTSRPVIAHAWPLCKEVHVLTSVGIAGGTRAALHHRRGRPQALQESVSCVFLGPGPRVGTGPASWGPGSCGAVASRWAPHSPPSSCSHTLMERSEHCVSGCVSSEEVRRNRDTKSPKQSRRSRLTF